MNAIDTYTEELDQELVRAGVPAPRREQAIAEVVAHVRDTGEDPVDAFGPPRTYADAYSELVGAPPAAVRRDESGTDRARVGMPVVVQVVLAVLCGLVVLPGLLTTLGFLAAASRPRPGRRWER